MAELKMPNLGAYMKQGKLLRWLVAPGDEVQKGQSVAVVDTDKAAIEIESYESGTIETIWAEPGETIPVGQPIARVRGPDEPKSAESGPGKRTPRPSRPSASPGPAPSQSSAGREPPASTPPRAAAPERSPRAKQHRPRASPRARRLAAQAGIDLADVPGSGPDQAITAADVERAVAAHASKTKPRATTMRQAIATAMAQANEQIPHYYLLTRVRLRHTLAWLGEKNEHLAVAERLIPAAIFVKAVAKAASEIPEVNGTWEQGGFVPAQSVNVAMVTRLRTGGLLLPVLHGAESLTLNTLMQRMRDLINRARAARLKEQELSGGTLSITNLGERGVETVYGVIYPPQVALVGFGGIVHHPELDGDQLRSVPCVNVTLAADHRVSDGLRGAAFLQAVRGYLESPEHL